MRPFEHTKSVAFFAIVGAACSARPPTPARAPDSHANVEEHLEEPYLPVRTEFTVVLEQPIAASGASPNQTFSARVRHPVRSPENEIVLPTGAKIRGTVVAIENKPALHVNIRFDDIDTTWGRAAIAATVRSAEPYATSLGGMDGIRVPYDAALYMPVSQTAGVTEGRAIGGGPNAWGEAGIFLPQGAELRIMLVKPLTSPPRMHSPK